MAELLSSWGAVGLAQVQSFDQTFDKMNLALKLSCIKGLPVRVVRSYKVPPPPCLPRSRCPRTRP